MKGKRWISGYEARDGWRREERKKERGGALKFRGREEKVRSRRTSVSVSIGRGWKTDRPPAKTGISVHWDPLLGELFSLLYSVLYVFVHSGLYCGCGYSDCLGLTPWTHSQDSTRIDSHVWYEVCTCTSQGTFTWASDFLLIWLNLGQFSTECVTWSDAILTP